MKTQICINRKWPQVFRSFYLASHKCQTHRFLNSLSIFGWCERKVIQGQKREQIWNFASKSSLFIHRSWRCLSSVNALLKAMRYKYCLIIRPGHLQVAGNAGKGGCVRSQIQCGLGLRHKWLWGRRVISSKDKAPQCQTFMMTINGSSKA